MREKETEDKQREKRMIIYIYEMRVESGLVKSDIELISLTGVTCTAGCLFVCFFFWYIKRGSMYKKDL